MHTLGDIMVGAATLFFVAGLITGVLTKPTGRNTAITWILLVIGIGFFSIGLTL